MNVATIIATAGETVAKLSAETVAKIEGLMTEFGTSIANVDYSLLLNPVVSVFPTVFTVMLSLAGIRKAIGFVKSILGC